MIGVKSRWRQKGAKKRRSGARESEYREMEGNLKREGGTDKKMLTINVIKPKPRL